MRVLIFHGYLLGGTGSNVYNACLAATLAGLGHEVHLICQDRSPEKYAFTDGIGDWDAGHLRVRMVRKPVRVTVYRPDIGPLLPVYVRDRYEGFEARTFAECTTAEIATYIDRNVAAVREVAHRVEADVALANHLIMGPVILARALRGTPYAVKVHGSALEYSVKPEQGRFLPYAREGLKGARGVLVGSRHTAESLWEAIGEDDLPGRTRLGPPGVDVRQFGRREPAAAAAGLRSLALRRSSGQIGRTAGVDGFALDAASAGRALRGLDPGRHRIVAFTGKLIVSKGVDLLLAAWPLVLARVPQARLVIVGFGAYRSGLERIVETLAGGDLAGLRDIALRGRELESGRGGVELEGGVELDGVEDGVEVEGGEKLGRVVGLGRGVELGSGQERSNPLRMLLAFLDGLDAEASRRYVAAAARMADTSAFTGRLDHADLAELLPACEAQVVPSTFPEAFGMVAVEAAACGVLPVCAHHSGLAEVSARLARKVPSQAAPWLSFGLGLGAVEELASNLIAWLQAPPDLREQTCAALAATAEASYSWEGVAEGVLAAAQGQLDGLLTP